VPIPKARPFWAKHGEATHQKRIRLSNMESWVDLSYLPRNR
jgi:hypothetical protein